MNYEPLKLQRGYFYSGLKIVKFPHCEGEGGGSGTVLMKPRALQRSRVGADVHEFAFVK